MKRIMSVKWIAVVMMAAAMTTVQAQQVAAGVAGVQQTHARRTPEQVAQVLMAKFDVNKDGELEQDELGSLLLFWREHHHKSVAQASQQVQHPHRSVEKIAAHMINKYSADKKGLTVSELATVIAARRTHRAEQRALKAQQTQPAAAPVVTTATSVSSTTVAVPVAVPK